MPFVMSKSGKFKGDFSSEKQLWDAIKLIEGSSDGVLSKNFIIKSPAGKIRNIKGFSRLTLANLSREAERQEKLFIRHIEDKTISYVIWLSRMNELYTG